MKKRAVFFAGVLICFFSGLYSLDSAYQSPYDQVFCGITDSAALLSALEDTNPEVVASALKRIGALGLASARPRVQLVVAQTCPAENPCRAKQNAVNRQVYYEAVRTLGRIGNSDDAAWLSALLRSSQDVPEAMTLLKSVEILPESDVTDENLKEYILSLKIPPDARITGHLIDLVLKKQSRRFISTLISLEGKVKGEMKDYVVLAIRKIYRDGVR